MAQNEEIALSLNPEPVPPDLECLGNLNMTQLLARLVQLLTIVGSGGTQPGQVFPSAVVIATQAKALAEEALTRIDALKIPQFRSGTVSLDAAVTQNISLSWSPDMPDNDYIVLVHIARTTGMTGNWSWQILGGTQTVAGVQLRLRDIESATTLRWVVMQTLPNA